MRTCVYTSDSLLSHHCVSFTLSRSLFYFHDIFLTSRDILYIPMTSLTLFIVSTGSNGMQSPLYTIAAPPVLMQGVLRSGSSEVFNGTFKVNVFFFFFFFFFKVNFTLCFPSFPFMLFFFTPSYDVANPPSSSSSPFSTTLLGDATDDNSV